MLNSLFHIVRAALALSLCLLLAGCESRTEPPVTVSPPEPVAPAEATGDPDAEVYATACEVAIFSGHIVRLSRGKFEYWTFSDVHDPEEEARYPLTGEYKQVGQKVDLPFVIWFKETIHGVPVLMNGEAWTAWKHKGELRDGGILIRSDQTQVKDQHQFKRPSIKPLYPNGLPELLQLHAAECEDNL